jgi:hypothetical protein
MKARLAFLPLILRTPVPAVRFAIPGPTEVEARYGAKLASPAQAFPPPDAARAIKASRRIHGRAGTEYWLRFASGDPAVGDTAWAHVFEPVGVPDPPSVVDAHGLGVELEMLEGVSDGATELARQGVRLVRHEAPWHNRRRLRGTYGGEPFLAAPPLSGLDFFAAELSELAALVAWCRRTSAGRVAIAGLSLGALATQLLAARCRRWPADCRPDAVFLATTTEDVSGLSFESSIARLVRLPQALAAAGWRASDFDRWRPLTDPEGDPALAPEDIVMVLGAADDVTPYERGRSLARRWRVPEENLFVRDLGHFSAALDLMRDPAPMRRLIERLRRA